MGDFVVDGTPFETPAESAGEGYAATPASLWDALGQQAGSTITSLQRVTEQGAYQGSGFLARMLYGQGASEAGAAGVDVPEAGSLPSPMLSHDEYQSRFAPNGPDGKPVSLGDGPMPEAVAQLVGEAKRDELERDAVLSRFEASHGTLTDLGAGAAGFMLDPLRAATAFVPGIGEEAIAARLGTGIVARTAARLGAGAVTGTVAQAPVSALTYALGQNEASDYGLRDAFRDMAFAAAGNAIMHAGFGAVGDLWRAKIGGALSEPAEIATAPAPEQHAAISASVSQIADGRPVDVRPIFEGGDAAAAQQMWTPDEEALQISRSEGIPTAGVTRDEFFEAYNRRVIESGAIGGQIPFFENPENETAFIAAQKRMGLTAEDQVAAARQYAARTIDADAVSQGQARLYRDGYAPGIPQREFVEPEEPSAPAGPDIHTAQAAVAPEEAATAEAKGAALPEEGGQQTPSQPGVATVDPELAEAERHAAELGAEMTLEETATAQGMRDAESRSAAVDEAALCLREAGL